MLGIPRHELPESPEAASAEEPTDTEQSATPASQGSAPSDAAPNGHRARARVRYDSANEPLPVIQRRKRAFRGLAVLVILAAAWLGYRFMTVHG
jgi:hypothetical protein